MFGWLRRRDWRSSAAHLLLLGKFRKGDTLSRYRSDSGYWAVHGWAAVLREKPTKAIMRFIRDGMLEPGELQDRMECQFKASDMKAMLKERGLKVSGRKEDLIRRLIDSDVNAMHEATKALDLYRCTTAGMQIAENYVEAEKVKREATESEVFSLITGGRFSKAVRLVAQYEASQVFPRGLGIDWSSYDGTRDVESLKAIFNATPAILKGIDEDRLRQLRPAAGMMLLWGTGTPRHWLPKGLETGIHLNGAAACRMLEFHARHLVNMKEYKKTGIKTVKVSGANDGATCSECRKINGKRYRLANTPELPYAKCTEEGGCRCMVLPCI